MFYNIRDSRRKLLIVFISLCTVILIITVGFAALSAALNVNVSSITQTVQGWDIGFVPETITAVEDGTSAIGRSCPTATSTKESITFGEITLSKPGDSCTYEFTVKNNGTIDGDLNSIMFSNPLEESCTGDASSKTCGNITYELTKGEDPLTTSNGYLCADDSYKVKVTIRNSGNTLATSTITQTSGRYTLTFVQGSSGACGSSQPTDPDDPTAQTLYNVLRGEATTGTYAKEYTGTHHDSFTEEPSKNIYYWYGSNDTNATVIQDKWNVIFGGFCWQMIRTTDTGGVKLLYNGVPSNGQCNNEGEAQQIGYSKFNTNFNSPAYVGYMYNPDTLLTTIGNSSPISGSLYGNGVTYNNGTYTLTNTSTTYDSNHHYTCNNTIGTCSTVRYYYYSNDNYDYYTEISDGRTIEEALEDMLSADNVNTTNSEVKTYIDNWYQNNMTNYTSYLEDTIFCNERSIYKISGWNPNGGNRLATLQFKHSNFSNNDLSCTNITDKFSISNTKAKLTYPVGLLIRTEEDLLGNNYVLRKTGKSYWFNTPNYYAGTVAYGYTINTSGSYYYYTVDGNKAVRPAISLKPGTMYTNGDGSKNSPYIVQ